MKCLFFRRDKTGCKRRKKLLFTVISSTLTPIVTKFSASLRLWHFPRILPHSNNKSDNSGMGFIGNSSYKNEKKTPENVKKSDKIPSTSFLRHPDDENSHTKCLYER